MVQGVVIPEAENIGMGRIQSLSPCTEISKVPKGEPKLGLDLYPSPHADIKVKGASIYKGVKDTSRKALKEIWGEHTFQKKY